MTVKEFKELIKTNSIGDDLIVFVNEENDFLVNQYIDALCRIKNCNKVEIQSIYEPLVSSMSFVLDFEHNLSVLRVDTFEERAEDYSEFTNTVVVCKKVDKKLEEVLEPYIIKIPHLQDWQIFDYIHLLCPYISEQDILWLIDAVKSSVTDERFIDSYKDKNGDIFRIINELDKVLLFPPERQAEIFSRVRFDSESDLYRIGFFPLINAVFQSNNQVVFDYFKHAKYFDIDPVAFTNNLLKNYKQLSCVLGGTGTQLGLTSKQVYAIQKSAPVGLSMDKIYKAIKFLSNVDLDLKSSKLDLAKERFIDYVYTHLMSIYRQGT